MSLLSFFTRKSSAPVARDRLQILLAHERGAGLAGQSDLVAKLQEEILAVIAKHIAVDRDKVLIKLDRGSSVSTLEIDIEVPDLVKAAKESAAKDAAKAEIEADAKPVGPDTKSGDGNNKKFDSQSETTDETKSDTKPDAKPALRAG